MSVKKKKEFIFPLVMLFFVCLSSLVCCFKACSEEMPELEGVEDKLDLTMQSELQYTSGNWKDPFDYKSLLGDFTEIESELMDDSIEVAPDQFPIPVVIQGISYNLDNPIVILNNQVFKRGEAFLGGAEGFNVVITDITESEVTIAYAGKIYKFFYSK